MLIDFHYYAIKVLCSYAGLSDAHAETVAYASQYVDDSVDYRKIFFSRPMRAMHYARYSAAEQSFDPICTAHKGINMIRGISHDAQIKVFIPFHFIPSEQYMCQEGYTYRTAPGSSFARELLQWALSPLSCGITDRSLIKAGIALHSFADTWAHQDFSGRYSHSDNNIDAIWIYRGGEWERVAPIKVAFGNLAPDIGHVEAFKYPDLSHLRWKYKGIRGGMERDNTQLFMQAAKSIYEYLTFTLGTADCWDDFAALLEKCMRAPDDKAGQYASLFPNIRFCYDAKRWRSESISSERIGERIVPLDGKKWFMFHEEAYEQRLYVMNRIQLF